MAIVRQSTGRSACGQSGRDQCPPGLDRITRKRQRLIVCGEVPAALAPLGLEPGVQRLIVRRIAAKYSGNIVDAVIGVAVPILYVPAEFPSFGPRTWRHHQRTGNKHDTGYSSACAFRMAIFATIPHAFILPQTRRRYRPAHSLTTSRMGEATRNPSGQELIRWVALRSTHPTLAAKIVDAVCQNFTDVDLPVWVGNFVDHLHRVFSGPRDG